MPDPPRGEGSSLSSSAINTRSKFLEQPKTTKDLVATKAHDMNLKTSSKSDVATKALRAHFERSNFQDNENTPSSNMLSLAMKNNNEGILEGRKGRQAHDVARHICFPYPCANSTGFRSGEYGGRGKKKKELLYRHQCSAFWDKVATPIVQN